jgi:hypothetical protein
MFTDDTGERKHSSSAMYTHFATDGYHHYNRFLSQLTFPKGAVPIRSAEEMVAAIKSMPSPHIATSGTDGSVRHVDNMLASKGDKESEEYKQAGRICDDAKEELRAFMRDQRLDAVIGPLRMYSLSALGALPLVRDQLLMTGARVPHCDHRLGGRTTSLS